MKTLSQARKQIESDSAGKKLDVEFVQRTHEKFLAELKLRNFWTHLLKEFLKP